MNNSRLEDLIFMFTYITGYPKDTAEKLILSTKTGMAVKEKQAAVWYEQQTENLYQIARELKKMALASDVIEMFTVSNIVSSLNALLNEKKAQTLNTSAIILQQKPALKQIQRKQLKQEHKQQLLIKFRNMLDLREV